MLRLTFSILSLLCGVAFLPAAPAENLEATPTPLPVAEMPEAEFQSLVQKTNLYVQALNSVSNAQRTFDRYSSWVDVKKGPTGKERYITYGLYTISTSSVADVKKAAQAGPPLKPALPELDMLIVGVAEAFSALEPVVKKASDYYEQEDYKDDEAKGAQELHRQMMPLFEKVFAGERALRTGLDTLKMEVDRRRLTQIEKTSGRNYEWHLRNFMLAAKGVINLLPEKPDAPVISAGTYKERYAELETAYSAYMTFTAEHAEEVKKVMMASFVESALKDFFTASKFLRRVLEAPKVDRREDGTRVNELVQAYNTLIQRSNSLR